MAEDASAVSWFGLLEEQKAMLDEEVRKREELKAERRKVPITPGPGAFDLPRVFGGKLEGLYSNNPYPTVHRSPVFSVPTACREIEKPDVVSEVGPGSYRPNEFTTRAQSRGCVFGTTERLTGEAGMRKRISPGVQLEQRDSNRYPASPRWGFGGCDRSKRGMYDKPIPRGCKMPGPGEHDPKDEGVSSKILKKPDYSFGIRSPHEPTKKDPVKVLASRAAKIFSDESRYGNYSKVSEESTMKSRFGISSIEFAGFLVVCFSEAVLAISRGAKHLRNLPIEQLNSPLFETLVEEFGFANISLFKRLIHVQNTCKATAETLVPRFVKLENDHINEDLYNRLLLSKSLREVIHEQRLSGYDTKENPMIFLFERLAEKQVASARKPPGPLTYEATYPDALSKKAIPQCSFGSTSPRLGMYEKCRQTPGPGAYTSSTTEKRDSGPKWSMTSRTGKHCLDHATI
mmetsp:Transcript_105345/g.164261  ORF Transcript_105345/g.164261 Transcript_105345/m.164261 type:complete len:459 (-) Transcript_105345:52-1428(-)